MISITPILKRELISQLRRPRSFLHLFLYLSAVSLCTGYYWWMWQHAFAWFGSMDRAQISRLLFLTCSYAQIVMVGILATTTGGAQISSERRRLTLDLLLTTPLRHSEIILGKAMASVGFVLLIAIAAIPIYALSFMMGGVGWTEFIAMVYLTLLTGVTYSMIGVGCSALPGGKRTKQGQMGIAVVVLLNGGIPAMLYLAGVALELPVFERLASIAQFVCSPLQVFRALTSPTTVAAMGAPMTWAPLVVAHTVVQVAIFSLFLLLGCHWIHKHRDVGVPRAAPAIAAIGRQPRRRSLGGLFPVQDWLNPVTAKDLLLAIPRRRIVRLLLIVGSVALFALGVWLIAGSSDVIRDSSEARTAYDITALIVICLAAMLSYIRAVGVVPSEAEAGTLPLLAITPLEGERILRGKLGAVLLTTVGPIAVLGIMLTAVYCLFHLRVIFHVMWAAPMALVCIVIASAFAGSLSLFITAGARTVRSAANRATLLLFVMLFIGPWFVSPFSHMEAWLIVTMFGIPIPGLPLFVPASDEFRSAAARLFVFAFDTAVSIGAAWVFLIEAGVILASRVARDQESATKA